MKTILAAIVFGGIALTATGCATPAYSAHERDQLIARNQNAEFLQITDDTDSLLLTRPMSHLTIWNVH